jgi:hypothetical protein
MAKSYKIVTVQKFDVQVVLQPFAINPQYSIPGVSEPPQTIIYKSRDVVRVQDFDSLAIEHEHEVRTHGRVNDQRFEKYIRKGFISGYRSAKRELLLLSGKKSDILSFCAYTRKIPEIRISTLRVDMKALLARLHEVKLVWFRYPQGMIHASALMGDHLEKTSPFREAKTQGDISTLSFFLQDSGGVDHPMMVTGDGAVVVLDPYQQVSTEIKLVLGVFDTLLSGIFLEEPMVFKASTKKAKSDDLS